jgi:hypothetical protein
LDSPKRRSKSVSTRSSGWGCSRPIHAAGLPQRPSAMIMRMSKGTESSSDGRSLAWRTITWILPRLLGTPVLCALSGAGFGCMFGVIVALVEVPFRLQFEFLIGVIYVASLGMLYGGQAGIVASPFAFAFQCVARRGRVLDTCIVFIITCVGAYLECRVIGSEARYASSAPYLFVRVFPAASVCGMCVWFFGRGHIPTDSLLYKVQMGVQDGMSGKIRIKKP